MAHLNAGQMKTMVSREMVTGVDIPETGKLDFCEACAEGKSHRAPFKPVGEVQSKKRLELVHSDVARPMKAESLGGARYFVTFIDSGVASVDNWRGEYSYIMFCLINFF